ncbi:hypothetical protein [Paraburkholderia sp.]|uniref:hypothetical protein n=1 Tax=Paraburkholderia sp. TaxID=1926495 RepID=UPI00238D114C|nr:hypothetical protein [Paraburkholderia sp.]MDE1180746.1 hypothetical protein [Paraburkholderia sp.]
MNATPDDQHHQDRVVLLTSIPSPEADAAEPFVIASERQIALVYRIASHDFDAFGPFDSDDDPFCLVILPSAAFHRLGVPGSDNLEIHPLSAHGIEAFRAHEVLDASLVEEMQSVLPSADPHAPALRHFVWTFDKTMFECVATDCTLTGIYGNGDIALREAFSLFR